MPFQPAEAVMHGRFTLLCLKPILDVSSIIVLIRTSSYRFSSDSDEELDILTEPRSKVRVRELCEQCLLSFYWFVIYFAFCK